MPGAAMNLERFRVSEYGIFPDFAGFGISLSNLLDLIAYFRQRKSCTVIPFLGGLFLMLGVNIAYPAAARFWYLF